MRIYGMRSGRNNMVKLMARSYVRNSNHRSNRRLRPEPIITEEEKEIQAIANEYTHPLICALLTIFTCIIIGMAISQQYSSSLYSDDSSFYFVLISCLIFFYPIMFVYAAFNMFFAYLIAKEEYKEKKKRDAQKELTLVLDKYARIRKAGEEKQRMYDV